MTPPVVSVILATYNRRRLLERTFHTVVEQNLPAGEYEIVVVDDGSTDGTAEWLRRQQTWCDVVVLEQSHRGPAVARNAGLRAARGDYILFLDDDLSCARNLLSAHLRGHRAMPGPTVVFGPLPIDPSSPETIAADWARGSTERSRRRLSESRGPKWPTDAIVDANSSALRELLLQAGGFDEGYFLSRATTAELGLRLWDSGARFAYEPEAVARQIYEKSSAELIRAEGYWRGRNEVLLCRAHPRYRPHSLLARVHEGSFAKRLARQVAARVPLVAAAPARLALFPGWRRSAAIRLTTISMGASAFRGALSMEGSWGALRAEFGRKLPVLLYHRVGPVAPGTFPELTVTREQLERHLGWISRRGYTAISCSDWLAWCREGKALPRRPVLLTFDDAYADTATFGLPILERHGVPAAVFVATGEIGGANSWDHAAGSAPLELMTTEQIRSWAERGIEFGAHSRTHADLSRLSGQILRQEIAGSRDDLARAIGAPVPLFAYPYGWRSAEAEEVARDAFELAFTIEEGVNTLATNPHLLRRTMVHPGDSYLDLGLRLRLGWNPLQRVRTRLGRLRMRLMRTRVE